MPGKPLVEILDCGVRKNEETEGKVYTIKPQPVERKHNENFTEQLKDDIFVKRRNIFLSGQAGTGKSYLLKDIKLYAEEKGWKVSIVSTTGVSAVSVGGTTIHSWSGIRLGTDPVELIVKKIKTKNKDCLERWRECNLLLIDEVSMLGAKTFEIISEVGKNLRRNSLPFGGLQVIFTGDFLQLPPINDAYAFESDIWDELKLKSVMLFRPYRFPDMNHFYMLTRIRLGELLPSDIKLLQSRVEAYNEYNKSDKEEEIKPTMLFSLKKDVEFQNNKELQRLSTPVKVYRCIDVLKPKKDKEKLSEFDKKFYTQFLDGSIPQTVLMKVGAQVMLTVNLSTELNLVNGSRGVVKQCDDDGVHVLFRNGMTVKIPFNEYETDDGRVKGLRYQIPLILAWCLSIHRSQGCSLDHAIMDLGQSIFAPNMAYVALSRARTLQGLMLSSFCPQKIFCSPVALAFEKKMNEQDTLEIF
jgi:ATP-dependent DNA helicase PIF1